MQLIATLATDRPCRDNTRFTPGALAYALQQNWERGVPSLIAHDMNRPLGWTVPTAMYFARSGCRLTGQIHIARSSDEMAQVKRAMTDFLAVQLAAHQDKIDALRTLIAEALDDDNWISVVADCVAVYEVDIARRVALDVFRDEDDDGLIEIAKLDPIGPGVYRHGKLALFAHRYLRRGATPLNTLNTSFLAALEQLPATFHPRVALDPDMVGLASTYRPHLEHQYWWGPEFDDDLSRIPVGVAQHRSNDVERFFTGIERTEFRWGARDAERIFEAEEIRDVPTFDPRAKRYACRYVHAIVSSGGGIGHFDGAVRVYDEDSFSARRAVDIAHTERAPIYDKLWRVDGDIPVSVWKRLLSDYFRDNHLVGEYLGAPAAARFGPIPAASDDMTGPKDPPAAFRITRGSGVRAGLSFRSPPEQSASRHIWPGRLLEIDGQRTPMIEADSLELVKFMARQGHRVELDPATLLFAVEDLDVNLATVWHPDICEIPQTVAAIRALVERWAERSDDRLLGFSVAYPIGEVAILLSVCGHLSDLAELTNQWTTRLQPVLTDPIRLADTLKNLVGDGASDEPRPDALESLTINRVLEVDRLELERGLYELKLTDRGLAIDMMLDLSDQNYRFADVEAGRVRPVAGFIVKQSDCAACGQPYRDCPCSRLFDPGCHQVISKAAPISVFLTPRPA